MTNYPQCSRTIDALHDYATGSTAVPSDTRPTREVPVWLLLAANSELRRLYAEVERLGVLAGQEGAQ